MTEHEPPPIHTGHHKILLTTDLLPRATKTMRNVPKLASLLILAGFCSVANALEAPPTDDIRCLIVGSVLSNATDSTQRTAGNMLAIYMMDRLYLFSEKEIEDAMLNETIAMTPPDYKTEAVRCGTLLQEKGSMMQLIGGNIVRRSKEINKPADTSPSTDAPMKPPTDTQKPANP